jgi:SAM-dependent methyltransferase
MYQFMANLVWCPQCKGDFCGLVATNNKLFSCRKCDAIYDVNDGVVDLVPELQLERGLAQKLMESPTMARIYEGKWWRRSRWQGGLLGIQFEQEADVVLQAAQVNAASTVLDLACASGVYTRLFAKVASQGLVVGMDISKPMLAWGVRRAQEEHLENVVYLRANASELPFKDAFFDCVNCCGALHLFPDLNRTLGEIVRVLKPSGRFTAGTFRKREGLFGRLRSKTASSIGVNTLTPEGMEATLTDLGFVNVRILHDATRWMILSGEKQV